WFGGLGPGLFATALATVLTAVFLVPDADVTAAVVVRGIVFILQGVGISLIALALQRAKQKAEQDAARAQATAEELRRRDDQIVLITDSLPVLISYIDRSHRYRFVNQAYEEWFGIPRDEIAGRHAREILGAAAYDSLRPFFDRAVGGELVKYEREVHYSRAGTREISATYVPHAGDGGRVEGFVVLVVDVSERKRVERELAEANRRAAIILESINEIFFSLDREWRITYVNRHYRENPLPGLERIRLGDVLWDIFPELRGSPFEERYRRALETGQPDRFEAGGVLSGQWYEVRIYPSAEGLSVFATDLTERKQAEEAVQAARAEAETANRMKDQFLATLSHELRTPLNAIFGWAQLLRSGKLDPATVERGVETIERNARVQKQLIDDLLDVSRIISGKLRLEMQPVEPADVVEAALETVAHTAQAKGISLRSHVARGGLVVGDAQRLQQVVWNLLSNAFKFTPKGGEVRVTVEILDGRAEITVADSGQGIAPEFLPHVF
ncbi:MAG: PAS domain-containing protein, partial [Thermoanaerobaculia bacterium]